MLYTKFKLGDKVIGVNFKEEYSILNGAIGKVIVSEFSNLGIEWEKPFKYGHDCNGYGKNGYCRFYTVYTDMQEAKENSFDNASNYQLILIIDKQMEFEF